MKNQTLKAMRYSYLNIPFYRIDIHRRSVLSYLYYSSQEEKPLEKKLRTSERCSQFFLLCYFIF